MYTRPKSPNVLLDLQNTRGLQSPDDNICEYWRQFFFEMDASRPIEIEAVDTCKDASIVLTISEAAIEGASLRESRGYRRFLEDELNIRDIESLKYSEAIESILEFSFPIPDVNYGVAYLPSNPKLPTRSFKQLEQDSELIPVQGREQSDRTLKRFSQLDRHGELALLVHVLEKLDHRVSDLRISMPDGVMDIWARVNGALLPLKAMGEGINRICHILVTMMSGVDYLFIDEIENGIHYSVQKDVWKAIGQVARELDIQVFATTHSYEMIRAAHEAFKDDDEDDFRFHRLYHDSQTDKIEARTYSEFSVEAAVSRNREVRG